MPLPLIAAGAIVAVSAIGNLLSANARTDEVNERIKRAQELAAQGMISQAQIAQRLRSIDRLFNQRLTSVLNTTAIRSRGFANTGTIGAAAAGQVEGARLTASESVVARAQDINTSIRQNIAGLELGTETTDVAGALIAGGASGATLAIEADKFIDRPEIADPSGATSPQVAQGFTPSAPQTGFNPFQPDKPKSPFGGQVGGQFNMQSPFGGELDPNQFDFISNVKRSIF